ncbi:hypothetical protein [Desulfitobacterium hafniense]|uniref:hypothetical protein n=1 Tax=Desulfitobacterium hafniense TaxID=49338 RepID=UPI000AC86085|nr:hypothetical protein [Desulfitobacterium hafniense]
MSKKTFQKLRLERDRLLGDLLSTTNRAKTLVWLIDIDEQLEELMPVTSSRARQGLA